MEFKIADVKEKEIDFLVAEEFASSPTFLSLILRAFEKYKSINFEVTQINRSYTDGYGESDLEIFLKDEQGFILALLLENKVSAQFQSDQLLRYKQRGQSYLEKGKCDDYKIILVAPKNYGYDQGSDIDLRIYYEDLIDWFTDNVNASKRYKFKEVLLKRALEKATHGYQLIEDEQTTKFWKEYWQLARKIAPILNMPEPGKRPAASSFIYFAPTDFPIGLSLVNKVRFGVIDLQIAGLAKHIGSFSAEFEKHFDNEYKIVKAGKSVSIRETAPILDLQKSVSEQEEEVRLNLEKSLKIYKWYQNNSEQFINLVRKWV